MGEGFTFDACIHQLSKRLIFLVRNFKPDYRFVSGIPSVMSRGYNSHVAWTEFLFFSIIHPGTHSARKHINEVVDLTALASNKRPYVF